MKSNQLKDYIIVKRPFYHFMRDFSLRYINLHRKLSGLPEVKEMTLKSYELDKAVEITEF